MIKSLRIIIISFIFFGNLKAQEFKSFFDFKDVRLYKTVKINHQIWMTENLNTSKFRNGDSIFEAKTKEQWESASKNRVPAWCHYNNEQNNSLKFGKLYNWYAIIDPRGISPIGWHIPSYEEWLILINFLGGKENASHKLKNDLGWPPNTNGTNESGFSGLPGGWRWTNGAFNMKGGSGGWWSLRESTSNGYEWAWIFFLNSDNKLVIQDNPMGCGFSLRLVKDYY